MSKVLFFFTASYPFGSGETFIENEISFLSEAFDKIIIVSNNCKDSQTRIIPNNVKTERISYELSKTQKIISISGILSSVFWKELGIIIKTYKKSISPIILKTMLLSLRKATVKSILFQQIIKKHSKINDSVYLYSYWTNDTTIALARMQKDKNIVTTFSRAHGWDVYFEANQADYLPFRSYILHHNQGIYFISKRGLEYYTNLFPKLSDKMYVSYLGVSANNKNNFQNNSTFTLVSCSNIISLKRIHLIIETLAIIDVPIHWIHFGDGPLMESIITLAENLLSQKKNIQFTFAGRISNTDIQKFYQTTNVDLFINVSSTEGIPVSIMEAMSYGIPCIATNVGGTNEIVVDSYNGFLLSKICTVQEVADTIINFYIHSMEVKTRFRQNAYETWNTNFNAQVNYSKFIEEIMNI